MNKYILGIDGMHCSMCEAHVKDVLFRSFRPKAIKVSASKNQALLFDMANLSEEDVKAVLDPTGYRLTSFKVEEAKKTFLGYK